MVRLEGLTTNADVAQAMAPAEDVWLIDHALSFAEVSDAVAAMRSYPDVLHRIADILEIQSQDAALPDAEGLAGAAVNTLIEVAPVGNGRAAAEDDGAALDRPAVEGPDAGLGDDALMQQVVGRLHEIVYEVVFRESAGAQRGSSKHRRAQLGRASSGVWALLGTVVWVSRTSDAGGFLVITGRA